MNNNQVQERALGWDDEITQDGMEFITLQPGEYDFKVEKFERAYFEGSAKMPACPQAVVHIEVIDPITGQPVSVRNQFLLHSRTEWTISAFFVSLGLKQKGVPFRPNWQVIVGKTGRCEIGHREYNGETYNDVKKFLEPEDNSIAAAQKQYDF